MKIAISDRLISIFAYFTFGIFSIVWLLFVNFTKQRITPYLMFNLYQAIFISVILAVISLVYEIALGFISVIPFIGKLANSFDIFFNRTPMHLSFTISGLIVTLLVVYLSILCLLGKKPYIPYISDVVQSNFGG